MSRVLMSSNWTLRKSGSFGIAVGLMAGLPYRGLGFLRVRGKNAPLRAAGHAYAANANRARRMGVTASSPDGGFVIPGAAIWRGFSVPLAPTLYRCLAPDL